MLFNSSEFLLFFPIVTFLYFALPHRFRWFLLLVASCTFYMFFKPVYILILFFTIVIDYYAGILIEGATDKKRRKHYLAMSIVANVGVLAVFKYYNFLNDNITGLAEVMGYHNDIPYLSILLPIGLSFHTFQAMSYTFEVYKGNQPAERHFGIYSLYVMFYPQLVAGPIERPQNVIHQFYEKHSFDYQRVASGLKLMAWGLFKKVVIADRLAPMVNEVYNNPTDYYGISFVIATIYFAIQIYCDFSGYSDIALGSAEVMGFRLMENFRRPYFSKTIPEFWRRWHISLSTWFRDYLYIPLGGNRVSQSRFYVNIFIVFMISGLWHGASWAFIIWGALHGFYQVFGGITRKWRDSVIDAVRVNRKSFFYRLIQVLTTFALACFAWIFFRANNTPDSLYIVKNMFGGLADSIQAVLRNENLARQKLIYFNFPVKEIMVTLALVATLFALELFQRRRRIRDVVAKYPLPVRVAFYSLTILLILFFGRFSNTEFIYFQF